MATILGLSAREHLLTNSAAEFLETRGDVTIGPDVAETSPEFVPEMDLFVARDNAPNLDCHKESREKLELFQRTLAKFQQNLIDSQADKKFNITIKNVHDYTLNDVFEIANTVQKSNKKLDNVHRCTKRIKKLFRSTGRNASTIKKLLAFAPTDVYGAVICGGFTMILGALEQYESLREKMYDTLEKIPLVLRKLDDWLGVHHKSVELRRRADDVLVAVFVLLELIVREFLKRTAKKIMKVPFKGEAYGSEIDEALATLEKSVSEFENTAKFCDSQRLGQMSEMGKNTFMTMQQLHENAKSTHLHVQQLTQGMTDIQEQLAAQLRLNHDSYETKLTSNNDKLLCQLEEKRKELTSEEHVVQLYNLFYRLFAANPSFDPKTGQGNQSQVQPRIWPAATPARPKLPKDWSKYTRRARQTAIRDLADCIEELGYKPSVGEQNRIAFILVSEEVRTYLRSPLSKLLVIDLQCDGDQDYTPASYAATVLIRSVQKIDMFPVLYHFCVSRASDPSRKKYLLAGSCGLLTSLICQLLAYLEDILGVDLDFLFTGQNSFKNSIDNSEQLLSVLKELLRRVPKPTCVYIIVDSVWKLQNSEDQGVLDGVLGLAKDEESFVKILVTNPFSLAILDPLKKREAKQRKRAKKAGDTVILESSLLNLYVPEHVDGGHHEFNTSWVEEEVDEVLRECSNSSQPSSDPDVERKKKKKLKEKKKKRGGYISSQSDTSSSGSDGTADSG